MQPNAIGMGKRTLEGGVYEQPEMKRPALGSVIVEAFKEDSVQELCSSLVPKLCISLEPILERVVSKEVKRALGNLDPARPSGRSPQKRTEGPDGRKLRLHFTSRLSLPLFTKGKVEGEQGAAIHVVLIDANTGNVVTSGPEAGIKLNVLVLEGDFNKKDDEGWTQEEFESHVVKERDGRTLLTGDLQVTLKEGAGTLGDLKFKDITNWGIRSRKFRLGLKVASGSCDWGQRLSLFYITEEDHHPPALKDEVWRLDEIKRDGIFHKKLMNAEIFTVKDFLRHVVIDQEELRKILGMANKNWDALLEHAKTCILSGKCYVYYAEDTRKDGVVFNDIYELRGLISGEQFYSADSLSDDQKGYGDSLLKQADKNQHHVEEYDGKTFFLGNGLDHQRPQSTLPVIVPSEQQLNSGLPVGGYNDAMDISHPTQPSISNSNSQNQVDNESFVPEDRLLSNHQPQSTRNGHGAFGLDVRRPQSSTSGFHFVSSSIQPSKQQLNLGLPIGGYNDAMDISHPTQPSISNSNSQNQFDEESFVPKDRLLSNHQPQSAWNGHGSFGLVVAPPQLLTLGFYFGSSSIQPSEQQLNSRLSVGGKCCCCA